MSLTNEERQLLVQRELKNEAIEQLIDKKNV